MSAMERRVKIKKIDDKVIDLTKLDRDQRNLAIYLAGNQTSNKEEKPKSIAQLATMFNVSPMTAWKWKNCGGNCHRKKRVQKDTKMTRAIKNYILKEAGDKYTCIDGVSTAALALKINKEFAPMYNVVKDKKIIKRFSISKTCVQNHLKKLLGKARKVKNSFKITADNIKARELFCNEVMTKNIDFSEVLFTDEKKFQLDKGINKGTNYVRLSRLTKIKLDKGNQEAEDILSSNKPKYSKSFMVAGGISSHGPGKLIFVAGNQDSVAYNIMVKYFKEDVDFLSNKSEKTILFQQDNAPCHTSGKSMTCIKGLFYKKSLDEEPKRPPKVIKKPKEMTKDAYANLKLQCQKLHDDYEKKLAEFKDKEKQENNKQDFLIRNWPANSPVNLLYLLLGS